MRCDIVRRFKREFLLSQRLQYNTLNSNFGGIRLGKIRQGKDQSRLGREGRAIENLPNLEYFPLFIEILYIYNYIMMNNECLF